MSAQHTPENWIFFEDEQPFKDTKGDFYSVVDVQGVTIADIPVQPLDPKEWALGNARLIAAAPDLLEALEDALAMFGANQEYSDEDKTTVEMMERAINKAAGIP